MHATDNFHIPNLLWISLKPIPLTNDLPLAGETSVVLLICTSGVQSDEYFAAACTTRALFRSVGGLTPDYTALHPSRTLHRSSNLKRIRQTVCIFRFHRLYRHLMIILFFSKKRVGKASEMLFRGSVRMSTRTQGIGVLRESFRCFPQVFQDFVTNSRRGSILRLFNSLCIIFLFMSFETELPLQSTQSR
jgi:hypothetical protein